MPKDSTKNDYNSNDDSASEDTDLAEDTTIEGEPDLDQLSDDVKEALGLAENGEEKIKPVEVKGKKPIKELTHVSDWLPAEDAQALENIDSLF